MEPAQAIVRPKKSVLHRECKDAFVRSRSFGERAVAGTRYVLKVKSRERANLAEPVAAGYP